MNFKNKLNIINFFRAFIMISLLLAMSCANVYANNKNGCWINKNDNWFYNINGKLLNNRWFSKANNWYYFNENGTMKTGWLKYNKSWYYFDASGKEAIKSWRYIDNNWYYFLSNGKMAKGFFESDGLYYFSDNSGRLLTNTEKVINGNLYSFDFNGNISMKDKNFLNNLISSYNDIGKYSIDCILNPPNKKYLLSDNIKKETLQLIKDMDLKEDRSKSSVNLGGGLTLYITDISSNKKDKLEVSNQYVYINNVKYRGCSGNVKKLERVLYDNYSKLN